MSESPLPPVALRHHRERTIHRLCEHFAHDHLEAVELEQLIDRAHRALTVAELDELVAGLPALEQPPAPVPAAGGTHRPSHPFEDQQFVVAVMGGAERKGAWSPGRRTSVLALMGGVCLDFRHASLGPGVTEINVLAIMGGVEIIVPPGLQVESSGIGVMGGFEHSGRGRFPVDSQAPVLRINGLALMGGVEIRQHPSARVEGGPGSRRIGRGEP